MPAILGAQSLPIGGANTAQLAHTPPNIYDALAVDERIASSMIIADTSATSIGTRLTDPRYDATTQQYTGVVRLLMKDASGAFGNCSGSLLWDRQTILTAAHCVAKLKQAPSSSSSSSWKPQGASPTSSLMVS